LLTAQQQQEEVEEVVEEVEEEGKKTCQLASSISLMETSY
tara:strand:- start:86 stop:205 length:120 start_codon:yes stop_codon:yes gene_type:complete